ncbi:uncharacterized protein KQ657_005121 [Scheffersomyces spartinae]|uniref:Protein kinase domain-containing protein n=1 Tax=Scheffersomyces spartinae TaxID=45513 RepID=A0A9P8AJ91_9ASCO|nr:uncharacterized protein KQ657_005121 [Scheffersomyces spartinae]KAG7193922.1 hypothetical protein KQ657_005121 [Scheffersomyces spartinae]
MRSMLAVGRHKIQIANYLSEGGFSKIYKVKVDPPIDNQIAEACLKQVVVPDKNALEVLRKEVEVMKTLKGCRNIVNLFDSNAERQEYGGGYQVLMLMELCPNGSLLDYMNANIETKLQEKEILKIMMDISVAVYELHKKDLVHRDIKVENVLIDHQKRFKLCDFGSTLSYKMPPKNLEEFRTLSHDILYHTTQQYRAPEMIDLYRQLPIDDKADIWALGCFLYKLCYYITPFEATGDLSVLHASFQFYNTPVFSSDLKNLIIIMLQENPVYRPNIVQVIILLAGMLGVEFPSLYVQDFYNNGPYNFHSLHEYQVLKQKELVHQQQLYIQQNARKTNKRIIDPTQFQQFQLQQPQQVPDHLNAHSTLPHQDAMVPNSSIPEKLQKQLHQQVQIQSTPVPLKLSNQIATLLLNPTTTTTEVDSKALNNDNKPNTTTTSPIVVTNGDVDSDLDDLTNIDNVEERFPLLDYFKVDAGAGGGAGGDQPADIFTNGAVSSDKGISSEVSTDTPVKTDKSAVVGNVESGNPVIVQPSAKLTAQNLAKNRPDFTSSNSVNKNTSLIVDDIFNTGSPLLKPQPQKTNQSVKSDSSKLLRWSTSGEELNVNDENTTIRNNETLKITTEFLDPNWKVIGIKSTSSTTNEGAAKKLSPEKDILLPKDANPWGLYRSTGGSSTNTAAAAQRPLPVPAKHEGLLPEHFNVLSLKDGKEQIMLEQSLIDLDADVNPPSLPQQPNKHVKEVQNSLLDLGVDFPSRNSSATSVTGGVDYGKNSGRSGHKRISSVTAPANFSLQEQVIDFESDNEESSEMNRLSIRNSLKKQGRKSSELVREGGKRKESSERKRKESTEKKRLSFFG